MRWTCPYCNQIQIVAEANSDVFDREIRDGYADFDRRRILQTLSIRCLQEDCQQRTLIANLCYLGEELRGHYEPGEVDQRFPLLPPSAAKPQPSYIPAVLVEDYEEACLIRDLSPKASATLSRRCLQGMIRGYCGISKGRLIDEIKELRTRAEAGTAPKGVELETIDAIDAVRGIGNIGAHMEKDINVIVEVDPGEAQALIELIELLFEEWYVARYKREAKLVSIQALAARKKDELEAAKAARLGVGVDPADPKRLGPPVDGE